MRAAFVSDDRLHQAAPPWPLLDKPARWLRRRMPHGPAICGMAMPHACYELHVVCYKLHVVCRALHAVCYKLHVVCRALHAVCYKLHVVCYKSHVVCYKSHVVCRALHAVMCMRPVRGCGVGRRETEQLCKCVEIGHHAEL